MKYYKYINGGYITSVSAQEGTGSGNISQIEYDDILAVIKSRPQPPSGYDYRLKEDLTWEMYKLPEVEDERDAEEENAALLNYVNDKTGSSYSELGDAIKDLVNND